MFPGNVRPSELESMNLKYVSLVILIIQTTSHVLLLRYSRTVAVQIVEDETIIYLSSTVVIFSEILKVFASLILISFSHRFKPSKICADLHSCIWEKRKDTIKLIVPAGMYVIQNNLLFLALTYLDAAVYQVTYQLKILTTAIFSVALLNRKLVSLQWGALFLLMIGVVLVQWPSGAEVGDLRISSIEQELVGLIAIILACLCSGFSGVYFEKILKGTSQSIWMRNIQLGMFSTILGIIGMFANDWKAIESRGLFQGYNIYTCMVIVSQAFGGLVIAMVIKYADNILKGFAASLSIIMSAIISYFLLHDFIPSIKFFIGAPIVVLATFMYGSVKTR